MIQRRKKTKKKKKWVITFEIWNALWQPQPGLLKFGSYNTHITILCCVKCPKLIKEKITLLFTTIVFNMLPKFGRNPNCIFFVLGVKFCQNDKNKNKNKRKIFLVFLKKISKSWKKNFLEFFFFGQIWILDFSCSLVGFFN